MIVILVCCSLIGSVAWVMPTPLQRAQAKIRQLAMAKGLKIKVGKLQGPREQGEVAPDSYLATSMDCPEQKTKTGRVALMPSKKSPGKYLKQVDSIPKVYLKDGAGIGVKAPLKLSN